MATATTSAAASAMSLLPISQLKQRRRHAAGSVVVFGRRPKDAPRRRYVAPTARLFGPAIFEASKLKVLFLGVDEEKHPGKLPRTYTLTHSDVTAKLTLAVSHTINRAQLQGWYNKLQRDEVVAEWKKVPRGFYGEGYMATGGDKCGDPAAAGEGGSDLYAVLGLKKECSDADLKVAYRKLAMRWHPDKCSSSSTAGHTEEAKEKFQEIQGAYSVLSDANKRFLYDVGVYDDDEDDDSLQGMGDFIGEMAQMMSQARPTRQESFEELQQLFVDMFQADLDSGFCNGSAKGHHAETQSQTQTFSTSPSSSPSPPPPQATEAEAPSCNGINKRGSSAMDSGKPPRAGEVGADQSQSGFCFGKSDTKQAPKMRGGSTSRRRDGWKQKLSSKHDVSSEDEISNSHQHIAA